MIDCVFFNTVFKTGPMQWVLR